MVCKNCLLLNIELPLIENYLDGILETSEHDCLLIFFQRIQIFAIPEVDHGQCLELYSLILVQNSLDIS